MKSIKFEEIPRVHVEDDAALRKIVGGRPTPVVLYGTFDEWPAMKFWNLAHFKERLGEQEFLAEIDLPDDDPIGYSLSDFQRRIRLSEFIDRIVKQESGSSYITNKSIDMFPGVELDVRFKQLFADMVGESRVQLWIGSARTHSSLHFDPFDNVLLQACGEKQVFVIDPRVTRNLYQYPGLIDKAHVDPEHPKLEKYPKFAGTTILTTRLRAGEGLYIPRTWWHAVRSMDPSISISFFHGPRVSVKELAPIIAAGGLRNMATIVRDFFWHGLLKRPSHTLYAPEPFGAWYYAEIVGFFKRRLGWG
jgi:Cupin-like domain